jgi:hypothetical protein
MLFWNKHLWLIDHGAALYFQHGTIDWQVKATQPFTLIKDHVLLAQASELEEANVWAQTLLTPEKIHEIVALIPDQWLTGNDTPDQQRIQYADYFKTRLANAAIFVTYAKHAREGLI